VERAGFSHGAPALLYALAIVRIVNAARTTPRWGIGTTRANRTPRRSSQLPRSSSSGSTRRTRRCKYHWQIGPLPWAVVSKALTAITDITAATAKTNWIRIVYLASF
jgi:hypothetical protein